MPDMTDMGVKRDSSMLSDNESDVYYPSMYIDGDQVTALGLDKAKVGGEMMMVAKVRVSSLSKHESNGGKVRQSASLEVLEMAVERDTKDQAKTLFGDK